MEVTVKGIMEVRVTDLSCHPLEKLEAYVSQSVPHPGHFWSLGHKYQDILCHTPLSMEVT